VIPNLQSAVDESVYERRELEGQIKSLKKAEMASME
jgi:hypothetical protein